MDSAYDAKTIDAFIRSRGRIPIIDPNRRNSARRAPLDSAKKERHKIRTAVERAFFLWDVGYFFNSPKRFSAQFFTVNSIMDSYPHGT